MKAKIHVLGPRVQDLQQYIPSSELEKEYGGKHAAYQYPDSISKQITNDGMLIKTSYFDTDERVDSVVEGGKMSAKRLDRIRQFLSRQRSMSGGSADVEQSAKAIDVPKMDARATVFGATGQTGILVTKRLLSEGYEVTAFVRIQGKGAPPELMQLFQKFGPEDRLQFVVGDLMNRTDVDRAIETSDVVVSCVGAPKTVVANGNEFYVSSTRRIVDSMKRNGTRRFVVITAAHVNDTWWDMNESMVENSARNLYWNGHYKYLAELEKLVENERAYLEYTFVRPKEVEDGKNERYTVEVDGHFAGDRQAVTRAALAKFIVSDCIVGGKHGNTGVAISSVGY